MNALYRRLTALLALIALLAFVAGAGIEAWSVIPAGLILLFAAVLDIDEERLRPLESVWRIAALLLATRATVTVLGRTATDPVLPMVDLLLLLLCAESLRARDRSGDARHFALTFALLIAAAAYRPGPLFGLLFIGYVACGTTVLVIGHMVHQARLRNLAPPAGQARFLRDIALLSSVVVAVSTAVFLFFPRATRSWAARPGPIVSAVVGFGSTVSIGDHGARIEPNPQVVMRIEFPDGPPPDVPSLRWRGRAYDRFDGTTWGRSALQREPRTAVVGGDGPAVEQVIYARPLSDANVLFGMPAVLDIRAESAIRPRRAAHGDWIYYGETDPVYTVRSRPGRPAADVLRAAGGPLRELRPDTAPALRVVTRFTGDSTGLRQSVPHQRTVVPAQPIVVRARRSQAGEVSVADWSGGSREVLESLQLPPLTARTLALADSFRAATPTPYDQAVAIERWLKTEFAYTLQLPATRREATLDHFLFERRAGHCEYFSTAMAMLLRAGGVPARNVNGFLGGDWNGYGRFLTVTQNNAHSWVEVYFPGVGWVTFDPTPSGGVAPGSRGSQWLRPVRLTLGTLEHRWGKWILDYDFARQMSFLRTVAGPFAAGGEEDEDGAASGRAVGRWLLPAVLAVVGLFIALLLRRRLASSHPPHTSLYLDLRRAYARAGFPDARTLPPLAFAAALGSAPGADHARRAVNLYLRARFGGRPLDGPEQRELERSVQDATARLSG